MTVCCKAANVLDEKLISPDVEPEAPRPSIDTPVSIPNSPQLGVSSSQGGLSAWRLALQAAESSWGTSGAVEGYGGLEGRVSR